MSYIVFKDIEKYYGENHVLKKTNLTVKKGEFVTLLGASGCGKSTLLRCFAGLEQVSGGQIFLDGKEITYMNPRERKVGMIFQQYSLFPNLNVYNNISFGLRMGKVKKDIIHERVRNAIKMVDLVGQEKKYPSQLSGGEQQRVALARCIVTMPKVLLLDEPLSSIDAKLRKSLQARIKGIHNELEMTSIFVTHDQDEAMTMADEIHLMRDGVIEQSGAPLELYNKPKNSFAASFIGNYNILMAKTFSGLTGEEFIELNNIAIRPEVIEISNINYNEDCENYYFSGKIIDIVPQGNVIRYTVDLHETLLDVDVLNDERNYFPLEQQVFLKVKRDLCIKF